MKFAVRFFVLIIVILGIMALMPIIACATIHNISIVNFAFNPRNSVISPGDTVRWTNNSISPHTSTSDTRIWSSGIINPNATYSREFLTPGVFPYQCSIHVAFGMRDTIHVEATGVDDATPINPKAFRLSQNYPNPFNAQTTIQYYLPERSSVSIEIFDILGRKITTLAEGTKPAGSHQAPWDANGQATGIFFYRLMAGNHIETRMMLLLK